MYRVSIAFILGIILGGSAAGQVTFQERAQQLGITGLGDGRGVAVVDLIGDRLPEIVMINKYGQNRLFTWDGDIYVDVGVEYGISTTVQHHSVAVSDIDKDHRPDLYITGEASAYDGRYFLNHGYPPFENVAQQFNLDTAYQIGSSFFQLTRTSELAVLCGGRFMVREGDTFIDITDSCGLGSLDNVFCPQFCDIDGDIDGDLFVAGNYEMNSGRLFRNNGDRTFTDISGNTDQGGFDIGQGAAVGDIDNDGDFDLYVCNGSGHNTMWQNDGTGFFANVTDMSNTGVGGYSRGAAFGDFDNDCDLDLFINRASNYNMMLLNDGQGVFTDVSYAAGIADSLNAAGAAAGDLNNDGQLDIIAANCNNQGALVYMNQNEGTNFLRVEVVGGAKNWLGLGTILDLYAVIDSTLDTLRIGKRIIQSHSSMQSVNELTAHFGTGPYQNLFLKATFPSEGVVTVAGVSPGQTVIVADPVVSVDELNPLPQEHLMLSAYPNPFNSSVTIVFEGVLGRNCRLEVFDVLGRRIRAETLQRKCTGHSTYIWDGRDDSDQPVPSGTYFVRVTDGKRMASTRIVLVK